MLTQSWCLFGLECDRIISFKLTTLCCTVGCLFGHEYERIISFELTTLCCTVGCLFRHEYDRIISWINNSVLHNWIHRKQTLKSRKRNHYIQKLVNLILVFMVFVVFMVFSDSIHRLYQYSRSYFIVGHFIVYNLWSID